MQNGFVDVQVVCPKCNKAFFNQGIIGGSVRQIPLHNNCDGAGKKVIVQKLCDREAIKEAKEFYIRLINL